MTDLPFPSFAPRAGQVDVWRIDLECPDTALAVLASVLSADERERAERFVFSRDRRRFTATRASLRLLLAKFGGGTPEAIRFTYSKYGKPALVAGSTSVPVHFNVSHAADVALIALSGDGPLGIDAEQVRRLRDMDAIASRFFAPREVELLTTLPPEERDVGFFLCWTRKEAFAKAVGDGLSLPLGGYVVACRPRAPAKILEISGSAAAAAEWSVYDLRPAPGFVGAVVMHGPRRRLRLRHLDLDGAVRCSIGP